MDVVDEFIVCVVLLRQALLKNLAVHPSELRRFFDQQFESPRETGIRACFTTFAKFTRLLKRWLLPLYVIV